MHAGLILATYCTHIFQDKLWRSCVTFRIINVKTYSVARRYIYYFILLNQNWEE